MGSKLDFEQGPIRPPNEARSFLLRITRNCPWNQCLFCPIYKNRKFSLRTVEEIKKDIQAARDIADDVKALSWKLGDRGATTDRVMRSAVTSSPWTGPSAARSPPPSRWSSSAASPKTPCETPRAASMNSHKRA